MNLNNSSNLIKELKSIEEQCGDNLEVVIVNELLHNISIEKVNYQRQGNFLIITIKGEK